MRVEFNSLAGVYGGVGEVCVRVSARYEGSTLSDT
jgi:hypothetical protein